MKAALGFLLCITAISALPKNPRIIGGDDALAGEFPYAAIVYKVTDDGSYICTGSLLTDQWIITAGQCVERGLAFRIFLGTHSLAGDPYDVVTINANTFVLHPDFNFDTLNSDIGLIQLPAPVNLTTYIQPLHLPDEDIGESAVGVLYGWGETSDDSEELSPTLSYVTLNRVSDDDCRGTYGEQITESMVCFRGDGNKGPCYGDSGSPVIQHTNKGYTVVIAISSFFSGNGCESEDPAGYTKVYRYLEWINEAINAA